MIKQGLRLSLLALSVAQASSALAVTPMTGDEVEARVGAMLDNMSQSEKINFTRVNDGRMIPKLDAQGLQGTVAYDSAMGVLVGGKTFGAQYPSPSALAATWSINRAKEFGLAIGYETRIAGGQQMLSPAVNLYRTPFNGRSAEYMSGEDPFLGAVLAPAVTNGIQIQGVQAAAKHYLMNEQEANRHYLDVKIDERVMQELYLPAFESMVKNANVASVMCGYNKINGEYACENHHLITDILKGQWGFQGNVMSDFNSIQDAFKGAWAGTDIDMPSGLQFTEAKLLPYVWNGQLHQSVIDDKVRRNLRALVSYGFDKGINKAQPLVHREYGQLAALNVARESIVLLRNEPVNGQQPLLPLAKTAKIAVIGDLALQPPTSPFGTAYSTPESYVSELSGLKQLASSAANVEYIAAMSLNPKASVWYQPSTGKGKDAISNAGVKAEYYANSSLSGDPVATRVEPGVNLSWTTSSNVTDSGTTAVSGYSPTPGAFSARFTSKIKPTISGPHVLKVRADGAYKLWLNDELVIQDDDRQVSFDLIPVIPRTAKTVNLTAGKEYSVRLEYRRLQGNYIPILGGLNGVQMSWASLRPPANLGDYDAVVVAAGSNFEYEGESLDHPFELPQFQSELISHVQRANPKTIVVLHGGGGMDMQPWANKVAASLHAWFPGQQGGQALAEILFGKVNPSGKLPITLDKKAEDNPSFANFSDPVAYYFSSPNPPTEMTYSEGLFMGYRGYDKKHAKPLYPFGYGLSYTTYQYSDLKLSSNVLTPGATINATFTVTNTGNQAGFEVAQLYVQPSKAQVERPEKELKGFSKVYLKPGESKTVSIALDSRSFAYYSPDSVSWNVDPGKFKVLVGTDSENLSLNRTVQALYAEQLTTRDSNPLPLPLRKAVQVQPAQAY
ncbi:glycoside hydrolase family 3 C-terminal domain-containing protein [Pseudomonas sp. nanlin1]|uniref:glycoside hydrolase family 3 C-terminal domain-containing protein n=1 Tax=Pseudomonas sp. nanlin1 TaxID=3040605 RepID=UPI00388DE9D3